MILVFEIGLLGMSRAHVRSVATVYMKDSSGSSKTLQECKQSLFFVAKSLLYQKNSHLLFQVIELFMFIR